MNPQRIAIIGAASLRCAIPVLASIFNLQWPPRSHIAMCDKHDEALDLFYRVARIFASGLEFEPIITTTADPEEALETAETVVLSFGLGPDRGLAEECIRPYKGPDLDEARRLTRLVLLHHTFEQINELLHRFQPQIVVNLVAPVELSSQLLAADAVHLQWPPPLPDEERVPNAHYALRIVQGDELPGPLIRAESESPLTQALRSTEPMLENRFNSTAVAGWLQELDAAMPGCRDRLLR